MRAGREAFPAAARTETSAYDAGGAMVRRTLHDGSATVYIGGVYEASYSSTGVLTGVVKYYPFGGRNVAMRDAAGKLHYLLADHLGSTVGVMDANGTIETTQTYWPYGAVPSATGVAQTDKRFTGQRIEPGDPAALGLYDYRARFYSTMLGRFVSADSVGSNGTDLYGYVTDDPLRYTDPTGHGTYDDTRSISACPPTRPDCSSDGGPPPAQDQTPRIDPGMAMLAAAGLTSPEKVQWARDVQRCAADLAACEALGGSHADPAAPSTSTMGAPCTGIPCADDYVSCSQTPGCTMPGTSGQQPLSCAMKGKGCQKGGTQPYAPGDSPWDPSNSRQFYTGHGVANQTAHVVINSLRSPDCDVAIGEAVVVGGVIGIEAGGTDGTHRGSLARTVPRRQMP